MSAKDILKYLTYQISGILAILQHSFTKKSANKALNQCTKAVLNINLQIKNAKSIGEKQNLLPTLAQMRSFRNQIKYLNKRSSGYEESKITAKDRVYWDDSTYAFDSRIRTGVIPNLKHKDSHAFLKDSFTLFRRRINNAFKKRRSHQGEYRVHWDVSTAES